MQIEYVYNIRYLVVINKVKPFIHWHWTCRTCAGRNDDAWHLLCLPYLRKRLEDYSGSVPNLIKLETGTDILNSESDANIGIGVCESRCINVNVGGSISVLIIKLLNYSKSYGQCERARYSGRLCSGPIKINCYSASKYSRIITM